MNLLKELQSLEPKELKLFWKHYLPVLAKSIKINAYTTTDPVVFMTEEGFGRNPTSSNSSWGGWEDRAARWYAGGTTLAYSLERNFHEGRDVVAVYTTLPIFNNYARKALATAKATVKPVDNQTTTFKDPSGQEEKNMFKNTVNSVVNKNKSAVSIATQLAAGKTANSFFLNKLLGSFPWYAKLFSKKKDVVNNPVAKMVAAQTALTLVSHFAEDNKKLNYIAEGMVQEALVDITVNSDTLESIIKELENLVTLPDFKE